MFLIFKKKKKEIIIWTHVSFFNGVDVTFHQILDEI